MRNFSRILVLVVFAVMVFATIANADEREAKEGIPRFLVEITPSWTIYCINDAVPPMIGGASDEDGKRRYWFKIPETDQTWYVDGVPQACNNAGHVLINKDDSTTWMGTVGTPLTQLKPLESDLRTHGHALHPSKCIATGDSVTTQQNRGVAVMWDENGDVFRLTVGDVISGGVAIMDDGTILVNMFKFLKPTHSFSLYVNGQMQPVQERLPSCHGTGIDVQGCVFGLGDKPGVKSVLPILIDRQRIVWGECPSGAYGGEFIATSNDFLVGNFYPGLGLANKRVRPFPFIVSRAAAARVEQEVDTWDLNSFCDIPGEARLETVIDANIKGIIIGRAERGHRDTVHYIAYPITNVVAQSNASE